MAQINTCFYSRLNDYLSRAIAPLVRPRCSPSVNSLA